jgi:hypothetical protein
MIISVLYAAPLALLYVFLSLRVITVRRQRKVSLGDGEDAELRRRIRVHANCAEYAPLGVLLLMLAESMATPQLLLHAIGATLLMGRLGHAYALTHHPQIMPLRVGGMVATFTSMLVAAASALVGALLRL